MSLAQNLNNDGALLDYSNGEMSYSLKGVHARVSVIWNFEAPPGAGDTHFLIMRGTKANVIIRQGKIVNDDLQKSASRTGALDLKVVAEFASEITKRAERLKDNLALPEIEKASELPGPKVETGIKQLLSSLSVLSNLINVFVENPVFEKSRLVDAKLSVQARRDLEQIIEVSKQVKRSSEKLKRARPQAV